MRKYLAIILALAMATGTLAGCGSMKEETAAPAPAETATEAPAEAEASAPAEETAAVPEVSEVSIGFASSYESILYGYIAVADYMGYFEDEGLSFTCEQSYSSSATTMVAEGQVTLSLPGPHLTSAGIDSGMDVISVFQAYPVDIFGVAVKADSPYEEWADLAGANFATMSATTANQLNPILAAAGVDLNSVTLTPVTDSRVQQLVAGTVDACWTWDGEWQQWVAEGYDIRFLSGEDVYKSASNSFIASGKFIEENPVATEALLRAICKGMYFCYCNPKAAADIILTQWTSLTFDLETATELVETILVPAMGGEAVMTSDAIGTHAEDRWALLMKDYVAYEIVLEEIPLEKCFTNDYVAAANNWDRAEVEADAEAYTTFQNE